jgi:hypothetical protein
MRKLPPEDLPKLPLVQSDHDVPAAAPQSAAAVSSSDESLRTGT